jgi:hypothetical protein
MLVFGERETADKLLSGYHHVADGTVGLVLDPAPATIVEGGWQAIHSVRVAL